MRSQHNHVRIVFFSLLFFFTVITFILLMTAKRAEAEEPYYRMCLQKISAGSIHVSCACYPMSHLNALRARGTVTVGEVCHKVTSQR